MSRWKASVIHLSISVTAGLLVGVILFGVWYPPPYFHAAGADELVLLLVGVDIVLGPLLTLVVFRSGKRGLKFDLTVIALLQASALAYGLSIVLLSRPVFLVGAVDRFTLVSASDIDKADLAQGSQSTFRSLSWTGARTVGAELPKSRDERNNMAFSALGGKDLEVLPRYYVEYSQVAAQLLHKAKPLDELSMRDEESRGKLEAGVRSTGKSATALLWLPVVARKQDLVMLIDAGTGTPLRAVAINPWPNR